MEQTDEQIAKEYAETSKFKSDYPHHKQSSYSGCLYGLKIGSQLKFEEVEKYMRFSEFTNMYYYWNFFMKLWGKKNDYNSDGTRRWKYTTKELYASQEFKEYLKQF